MASCKRVDAVGGSQMLGRIGTRLVREGKLRRVGTIGEIAGTGVRTSMSFPVGHSLHKNSALK